MGLLTQAGFDPTAGIAAARPWIVALSIIALVR
jgi:hypothetical protein